MKKNNFWNRVFHTNEVTANQKQYKLYIKQLTVALQFIATIKVQKDLTNLLNVHKDAYGSGFTLNLGPGAMFRCKEIATMTPHQVYLGGIYGLNTYAIPFWEQYTDEPYGVNGFGIKEDQSLYEMILNQYKQHLISNIRAMYNKALKEIPEYELCGYRLN
jgi:hypothetical protein